MPMTIPAVQRVILVTGPSGAGRSTAIDALEDLGCEPIDNLPLSLIPRLLDGPPLGRTVALGVDVRNRDFVAGALIALIDRLTADPQVALDVVFLDCRTDVLVQRYAGTRRRHPLAPVEPPLTGILREIDLLAPVRARADTLIDTSNLTPHDLRAEIVRWLGVTPAQQMAVSLHSFSYRRGLPRGMDMVFDCRFLQNPHWVDQLRGRDGRDPAVVAHVVADPRFDEFFERLNGMIDLLLPGFLDEGKAHLAIGFGCTGGRHRSVAMAERLGQRLRVAGWQVLVRHRELERQPPVGEGAISAASAPAPAPMSGEGAE